MNIVLPKCATCGYQFKRHQLLAFVYSKKCPSCQAENFVTKKSRLKSGGFNVAMLILFLIVSRIPVGSALYVFVCLGVVLLAIVYTHPRLLRFTKTDQDIFSNK
ncbi:hypothetical protein FLK61_28025 [Paenalkalicoccus suaedae]|uniref:Cxxc_20_cxxc protein n=1 Tax=Paenalkalicoccus suaedae TaxID=2592382 RepID=A0A859FBF2_9BACI|nr:TIGR04104 family putative zinc finger protein [Paenalkalicoccus suaedae]QKS70599.1 hypothetical protein FLK61_28025 [Paenalkalicoccus suaedae]